VSRLFTLIGILVGTPIGSRVFDAVWGTVEEAEPPDPAHNKVGWPKMLFSAAVKGAIVGVSRAVVNHSTRRAFSGVTGTWPGAERPDPRS